MLRSETTPATPRRLPTLRAEELLQARLAQARSAISRELGIEEKEPSHFKRPAERPFTRAERERTTILFGGLTWKHEQLIQAVFRAMGYKAAMIPAPDVRAFALGKEYGNNGQCNPTYFTVGNLVQHLQQLEKNGESRREICDNYVFFTAGACGPCRFGMYEAEYRLALRNSGFGDFRVLIFGQHEGMERKNRKESDAGLDMNLELYLTILTAISVGDLINEVAYQIRPYEVNAGETDRVLRECIDRLCGDIAEISRSNGGFRDPLHLLPRFDGPLEFVGKLLGFLDNEKYLAACRKVRDRFNRIRVDRTRAKPVVKITGEFFAQTTEGDGNFNMFRFLEAEGAEVVVEPVTNWISYTIHQAKRKILDRKDLDENFELPPVRKIWARAKAELRAAKMLLGLAVFGAALRRQYDRLREAMGGTARALTNQLALGRLGHPYYNMRSGGGEGHLEVAKNIYYHNKKLCHMVLSLKPFGCMPSTQSDGAQSAVVNHYKDIIYLPVETSGEGEINAHSRVQMALGEAKAKAKAEFAHTAAAAGYTLEQIRSYVARHPELSTPFYSVPKQAHLVGSGANFLFHVATRMREAGVDVTAEMARAA